MSLFNTKFEDERRMARERLEKLISKGAVVNITEKFPQRTLAQNRYMRLLFAYFASQYGCSVEEAKIDFFERKWNADLFIRSRENKNGVVVNYLRSTTELTTQEMTLAIDRFRHQAQMEAGIYLPSPSDRDFILHCEQEIENNKEFIQYDNEERD